MLDSGLTRNPLMDSNRMSVSEDEHEVMAATMPQEPISRAASMLSSF